MMMNKLNLLLFFFSFSIALSAQNANFFSSVEKDISPLQYADDATIFPDQKRNFKVDFSKLQQDLQTLAPGEFSGDDGYQLTLPLPNGDKTFEVYYSPVYEQGFQEKHPNIRTYKGYALDNSEYILRMTISQLGLKGSVRTPEGEIYIDPFIEGQTDYHASYFVKDFPAELVHENVPACGNHDIFETSPLENLEVEEEVESQLGFRSAGQPINLRTFRCAIATTGEWTRSEGGKANALAKVVACVDRGNQVFENEVGFRLLLVANNATVVYDDPDLDPYPGSEPKSGGALIGMNTGILNSRLGSNTYDIGHIFTNRCSDVGGIASLASVCGGNKGSGCTCWYNRNLDYTVVRIMCHEMGHQFSGPHTFNNCGGNESGATAYEPGSGSTIMSYGGLCGSNNVVSGAPAARDITYYHANSVMRLFTFSRFVGCGGEVQTNNTRPDANLNYEDDFYIPISTPFYLEGEGIDMEGDNLTYCFEQHDYSARQCPLGNPTDDCPLFRSFPPHPENYRVFPQFPTVWNNQIATSVNEVLPDYSREINFVLTVRDNNSEVGAFGMDTMMFNSTDKAGPFRVEFPNNAEDLIRGSYVEVQWDVANTNSDPVNCKAVDILFYNSSAWDDYEVLALSTPNDGSEWVQVPDAVSSNNKIMVRAADNIFFDISNRTFSVVEADIPGYTFGITPNSARVCLPDVVTVEILSSAFGGFSGQLELDVISGLPANATYSFNDDVIDASQNTILEIDMTNVVDDDDTVIEIQAISDQGDTLVRSIDLDIVRSNYSALEAVAPVDGVQGVVQSPTLEWPEIIDADYYNVQLATNPSFRPNTIIQEWERVTTNRVDVDVLLDKNSIFYWRVQAGNVCTVSDYIVPVAFSTEAASCAVYEAPDKNVNIPRGTTREFGLNIFTNADINDVNVSHLDFFCDFLQDAKVSLISPEETEVVLFDNRCGNTTVIDCTFDDDAPTTIKCPPNTGLPYQPAGQLSDFNGETAQGKWNLKVELTQNAASSELYSWELELCSNTILDAPVLVRNDTMETRPSENNPIFNSLLRCEDNNNDADELEYTLSKNPTRGVLYFNGNQVTVGMTFTQADIDAGQVRYENVDGEEGFDSFYFTVNDGEGGWTGTHRFDIALDDDFASSVTDLNYRSFFKVIPNPTQGAFSIYFEEDRSEDVKVLVTDVKGAVLYDRNVAVQDRLLSLDLSDENQGVYLVRIIGNEKFYTEKVVVTR